MSQGWRATLAQQRDADKPDDVGMTALANFGELVECLPAEVTGLGAKNQSHNHKVHSTFISAALKLLKTIKAVMILVLVIAFPILLRFIRQFCQGFWEGFCEGDDYSDEGEEYDDEYGEDAV